MGDMAEAVARVETSLLALGAELLALHRGFEAVRASAKALREALNRQAQAPASMPAPPPVPPLAPAPKPSARGRPGLHRMGDKNYSLRELSELAGCSVGAMRQRLLTLKLTPEQAVARGASQTVGRPRAAIPPLAAVVDAQPKQKPPTFTKLPPAEVVAQLSKPAPRAPLDVKLDPKAEAIVPDSVKRTIAPTPPDRYQVDQVIPVFGAMRPGEYLPSDTALSRAARGKP